MDNIPKPEFTPEFLAAWKVYTTKAYSSRNSTQTKVCAAGYVIRQVIPEEDFLNAEGARFHIWCGMENARNRFDETVKEIAIRLGIPKTSRRRKSCPISAG